MCDKIKVLYCEEAKEPKLIEIEKKVSTFNSLLGNECYAFNYFNDYIIYFAEKPKRATKRNVKPTLQYNGLNFYGNVIVAGSDKEGNATSIKSKSATRFNM